MLSGSFLIVSVFIACVLSVNAFGFARSNVRHTSASLSVRVSKIEMQQSMRPYIPDGLTLEQYESIRLREAEKKSNLGAVGIQKFKSRSMQAFQESKEAGQAKHLFPSNPKTTPLEERPYMMRRGGDWEATDLKMKGLQGKKQGSASPRLETDDVYDSLRRQGKLNSVSIFSTIMGGGQKLPWTL